MRRLTKKAWFGPKRYLGWGWSIRSSEGAVVTVVFVVLIAGAVAIITGPARFVVAGLILVGYFAVAFLTGDPPGGPSSGR